MVADFNVHRGVASDGEAQPHAHVSLSIREVENDLRLKRGWNHRALLRTLRERWATLANERLAQAGHDSRFDHRSRANQSIALEPQNEIGSVGARRYARGENAERADEHRKIARRSGERRPSSPSRCRCGSNRPLRSVTSHVVHRQSEGATQFKAIKASPEWAQLGRNRRGPEELTTSEMVRTKLWMREATIGLSSP